MRHAIIATGFLAQVSWQRIRPRARDAGFDHARLITSQLLDYRPLDWDIGKL